MAVEENEASAWQLIVPRPLVAKRKKGEPKSRTTSLDWGHLVDGTSTTATTRRGTSNSLKLSQSRRASAIRLFRHRRKIRCRTVACPTGFIP